MELITNDAEGTDPEMMQSLDELVREGARRMIVVALELEVDEYVSKLRQLRDEDGHALVVRNGHAQERTVTLGAGPVKVSAPRLPRPAFRVSGVAGEEALPVLPSHGGWTWYLRGLSTGDFAEALPVLLGPDAAGLSPTTITRLTQVWQDEYQAWRKRSLAGTDYVYIWADGVYFSVRLEEDRLACLAVMGGRADGTKEIIALEDGYRESQKSWASLLRDLRRRGMPASVLAVGDGALGLWAALRDVYPETREQRYWVSTLVLADSAREIANVLDKLPKRLQPGAKAALHEITPALPQGKCARTGPAECGRGK